MDLPRQIVAREVANLLQCRRLMLRLRREVDKKNRIVTGDDKRRMLQHLVYAEYSFMIAVKRVCRTRRMHFGKLGKASIIRTTGGCEPKFSD
jgi:hypothetical protein